MKCLALLLSTKFPLDISLQSQTDELMYHTTSLSQRKADARGLTKYTTEFRLEYQIKVLLPSGRANMLFPSVQRDAEDHDCNMRVYFREEWDKMSARHLPNNPRMHIPDVSWSKSNWFYRCLGLKGTIKAHVLALVGNLKVKVMTASD